MGQARGRDAANKHGWNHKPTKRKHTPNIKLQKMVRIMLDSVVRVTCVRYLFSPTKLDLFSPTKLGRCDGHSCCHVLAVPLPPAVAAFFLSSSWRCCRWCAAAGTNPGLFVPPGLVHRSGVRQQNKYVHVKETQTTHKHGNTNIKQNKTTTNHKQTTTQSNHEPQKQTKTKNNNNHNNNKTKREEKRNTTQTITS